MPAPHGRDSMRVWLVHHLNVSVLRPVPLSEVPEALRPVDCRWNATTGRTTHGYVLILTDDQHLPRHRHLSGIRPEVGHLDVPAPEISLAHRVEGNFDRESD